MSGLSDTPGMVRPGSRPVSLRRRAALGAEFLVVFAGAPLLVLALRQQGLLFGLLWAAALVAAHAMRGDATRPESRPDPDAMRGGVRTVLLRFAVLAPLITLATLWAIPQDFLTLPLHRTRLWAAIMVLYPLLSVWPQEMLYRRFLFYRYAPLLRTAPARIMASAVAFGFAHVLFLNPIAIIMTVLGGGLFARDYARYRSLRLACFEHSLYGCLIFTIGLGRFFYTGASWHAG